MIGLTRNLEWACTNTRRGALIRDGINAVDPEVDCYTEVIRDFVPEGHRIEADSDYGYAHNGTRRKVILRSKPGLHISSACYDPAVRIQGFVEEHGIKILNVAGSRESKDPGIYQWVKRVLVDAFFWGDDHPGMLGGPGEG